MIMSVDLGVTNIQQDQRSQQGTSKKAWRITTNFFDSEKITIEE